MVPLSLDIGRGILKAPGAHPTKILKIKIISTFSHFYQKFFMLFKNFFTD